MWHNTAETGTNNPGLPVMPALMREQKEVIKMGRDVYVKTEKAQFARFGKMERESKRPFPTRSNRRVPPPRIGRFFFPAIPLEEIGG